MTAEIELPEAETQAGVQTVEVHFKGNRRSFFTWDQADEPLRLREAVIVDAARGLDFGRVSKTGSHAAKASAGACNGCSVGKKSTAEPIRKALRRAAPADIAAANQLRHEEETNRQQTIEKVRSHKLDMRVSDTEWQWDRSKLTLYFTAEQRGRQQGAARDDRESSIHVAIPSAAARCGGTASAAATRSDTSPWPPPPSPPAG